MTVRHFGRSSVLSVSVEEIGKRAGVGRATAYRVLTDHPHVSATIREKVMSAVRELGYPRLKPRSAKRRRGGYLLWGPLTSGVEPDAFFYEVYGALEAAMASRRRAVRSISFPLTESPTDLPAELAAEDLDGIFTVAFYSTRHLAALAKRWPLACLLSTRLIPGAVSLAPDYADAARQATEVLLAAGHRRIGLVTGVPSERNFSRLFTEGYAGALAVAGIPVDPILIHSDSGNLGRVKPTKVMPLGIKAGRALLERPDRPTAIIARQDSVSGVLTAAKDLGLRVPEDLSVVGFGTRQGATEFDPVLTSACFSTEGLVDLALQMIKSVPAEGARALLPVEMVEGASVRSVR
jgi:LacI family transcriptional regulator, galactose operon repressor